MQSLNTVVTDRFHRDAIGSHNSETISNGLGNRPKIRPGLRCVRNLLPEPGIQVAIQAAITAGMLQSTGRKEAVRFALNARVRRVNRHPLGQRYEHPHLHHENIDKPKHVHVRSRHVRLKREFSDRRAARVNRRTQRSVRVTVGAKIKTDNTDTQSSSVLPSRDASLVSSQARNAMQPAAKSARTTAAMGRKVCIAIE